MLRSAASKVMWVGRATVFLVGLAVILALVLGAASMAMSATGGPFILGERNVADQTSKLVKRGAGAALSLRVKDGQPPLKVDSSRKVASLNADEVDGLSAEELVEPGPQGEPGFSGYERVVGNEVIGSGRLESTAVCSAGKEVLGGGFRAGDAQVYTNRPINTDNGDAWQVQANMPGPFFLQAYAICADVN
jgi:hypothetical protein